MWYWIIVALLVGLCRDVCIVFGNQTEAKRRWRRQKEEKKNVGMNMKMSMRRVRTRSKQEREAQAMQKDQRPNVKKRRWKIILEDNDSWKI